MWNFPAPTNRFAPTSPHTRPASPRPARRPAPPHGQRGDKPHRHPNAEPEACVQAHPKTFSADVHRTCYGRDIAYTIQGAALSIYRGGCAAKCG